MTKRKIIISLASVGALVAIPAATTVALTSCGDTKNDGGASNGSNGSQGDSSNQTPPPSNGGQGSGGQSQGGQQGDQNQGSGQPGDQGNVDGNDQSQGQGGNNNGSGSQDGQPNNPSQPEPTPPQQQPEPAPQPTPNQESGEKFVNNGVNWILTTAKQLEYRGSADDKKFTLQIFNDKFNEALSGQLNHLGIALTANVSSIDYEIGAAFSAIFNKFIIVFSEEITLPVNDDFVSCDAAGNAQSTPSKYVTLKNPSQIKIFLHHN